MILEGAIGDAYGAGFEFASYEKIRTKNNLSKYETHPLYFEINGKYTDDSQMSIAIGELLLESKEWTPLLVANKFVEVFKRDPRRGYAKGLYKFFTEIESGGEMLERIEGKSERNGAAMRAYPIGIIKNENDIISKCNLQSKITHDSEKATIAAQAMALSNHYFIYSKGDKKNLLEYLQDIQKCRWNGKWDGKVHVDARETVEAVLSVILNGYSLKKILHNSIEFGGDVDTVASLALAIGKMSTEIENDLPEWLFNDLENEEFGRDYIKNLDNSLLGLISSQE